MQLRSQHKPDATPDYGFLPEPYGCVPESQYCPRGKTIALDNREIARNSLKMADEPISRMVIWWGSPIPVRREVFNLWGGRPVDGWRW
jgi:hypothetical protein